MEDEDDDDDNNAETKQELQTPLQVNSVPIVLSLAGLKACI